MLYPLPKAVLTEDFPKSHPTVLSFVLYSSLLLLQGVFLLSGSQRCASFKGQTKQGQLHAVKQSSSWVWYFAGVCVSQSMYVRRGGSYTPSNHLLLQLREKNLRQRRCVCMSVSACVVFILQLALSWQTFLFFFQSIIVFLHC